MHSSRMRTGRLLPVSPSMHCSGGGCVPAREVYLPGGCTCLGGVPAQWDVPAWEVYLSGVLKVAEFPRLTLIHGILLSLLI